MPSNGQETKPIRLILDTNILISALLFSGKLGFIGGLIERGIITPCFIESTFREFQNALEYSKFTPALAKLDASPEQIIHALAERSQVLADPKEIPSLVPGEGDNYILAAAAAAKAAAIVTGDKLLLQLEHFQDIPIIKAKDLQNFLKFKGI